MALDTATARASALHVGLPALRLLPVPDATIGQADRVHVGWGYAMWVSAASESQGSGGAMPDLTTVFAAYLVALRAANDGKDLTTLVAMNRAIVKAAIDALGAEDDENTMYARHLGSSV